MEDEIKELLKLSEMFKVQFEAIKGSIEALTVEKASMAKSLGDLTTATALHRHELDALKGWQNSFGTMTDVKTDIALLERETDELKAWKDDLKKQQEEWGRKVWMLVPPIVAALLSSALTGFITYLLRR